jgi:hypothetical protein
MLPTMSVCHDVIRISDGKVVGAVESIWSVDGSNHINTDGFPSGGVLNHTLAFGNVPKSVLWLYYSVGDCRNYDSYIATKRAAYRYKLSPRG